jgi:hypothetical protein
MDDPRRVIGAHGVPVVELLSEGESETHRAVLRPDADGPADRYRLYQVAGTGHVTGRRELTTNRLQMQDRGWPEQLREVTEQHSDGRMDLVARAVFHAVDRWAADGTAPPVMAERFGYADPAGDATRGVMPESLPLARDADGNVLGGIRTPWAQVPAAAYFPHSSPVPGRCNPAPHAPYSDPAMLADLVAHMKPFTAAELTRRYGGRAGYLSRLEAAGQAAVAAGWLLAADLPGYLDEARTARDDW